MNVISLNLPLVLTLLRLILSPLLVPLLFIELLPAYSLEINIYLAILFILLSLTDFFDGYFARRYRQETLLGRILDPIADKFLLHSTLVTLVYLHKLYFYWAIIFIGREFFVMGLRQVASSYNIQLTVLPSAKLKTFVQMVYLTVVILNPFGPYSSYEPIWWNCLQTGLLLIALYISVFSAVQYYVIFIKKIRGVNDIS